MKEKKALVIVGSPFQLLCAFEALKHFDITDYHLAIRTSKSNNGEQINRVLKLLGMNADTVLFRNRTGTFLQYVRLFRKIRYSNFDYAFMGENGTAFRSLVFSVDPKEIFLLDDGMATLEQRRYIEDKSFKIKWKFTYSKLRSYRYALFGMRIFSKKEINYFSCIIKKKIKNEFIITHSFEGARKFFEHKKSDTSANNKMPAVLYLDTDHVESNLLTELQMSRLIDFIGSSFAIESKIGYRPHRGQRNDLVKKFVSADLFLMQRNDMPIEIECIVNGTPEVIIGTITTALITLKRINPFIRVIAVDISNYIRGSQKIEDYQKDAFCMMYDSFREEGIEVVSIEPESLS